MAFYYIFPIIILIIALSGRENKRIGIFLFIILLFFSMFRGDNVGTDTLHYIYAASTPYQVFKYGGVADDSRVELLYNFVNYCIYSNNLNPHYIIYFLSIITFAFLFLSARRFKVGYSLVVLFYVYLGYYYLSFNIARQIAAMSIALYGLSFMNEETKKKYLFFIWVLVAALIHNTVIIVAFAYFLRKIHFNKRYAALIVGTLYVVFMIFPITPFLMNFLGDMNMSYSSIYGKGGNFDIMDKSIIGVLYHVFNGVLLLTIFLKYKEGSKTDFNDNYFLMSLLVFASLYHGNLATYRFAMIFTVFQCIYLSSIFTYSLSKKIAFLSLIICFNYYFISATNDGAYYLQL